LAETRQGYANICHLLSGAHLADPDRQQPPLVTLESLRDNHAGVICLTGCRHGEVGYLVDHDHPAEAKRTLQKLRDIFGQNHLFVELQYFGYEPHHEARAGQHGSPVYEKVPADGGRLRHRPSAVEFPPTKPAATTSGTSQSTGMRYAASATNVTSWQRVERDQAKRNTQNAQRPDLPEGQPQRLNPADYDVGFHHDGTAWRLSCLTYCVELAALAEECGLPVVLTTNAHYARENDRALHLVCRAAGRDEPLSDYPAPLPGARCLKSRAELMTEAAPLLSLLGEPAATRELHHDGYAMSVASSTGREVRSASPLDTPWLIAQRCNVDLELGTYHFPKVDLPTGETAYSLLAKRCFRGVARKYRPVPPKAVELLEKELRMIQQMEFAHYFLVVHDIVRWAREQGIACSGRGSAGNSIVCHALDITASEPIRHNLLFERFLNPNRREMPDIDIDFCSSRRDEVIEHIYNTFGSENVAIVANINTMSPRSAVRIVAEALGYAPTEINALAKHVPRHGDAARLREYLAGTWPELRDSPLRNEDRWGKLLDLVERLDSFPMHLGTHLGGFVIADKPISYYAPLQWAAKGVVVVQFNKDDVAALGLVKMDILGLRTHSAVSECVHIIRQRTGKRIRPYELPPEDPAAYEIISNGGSIGLFQLESAGQRNLASRLQERDFDDVIAAIALYRPGPLEAEMISPFIDRRWGIEPVTLPHPAMAEALGDTYGVILYQEQVLRVAQLVAGFDLADADSLRRAMTRDRSREDMAKIGETFISRAVARGVPEEAAREVFRQLEGFAAYGFNKSHSVCFAVISYATAWLKAYYPAEFLCAVLNNYPVGFYTPRTVLNDARRFGLEVRPLDINLSGRGFTVEGTATPDPGSYDPFAQAWTAEHGWGLTGADLNELRQEQNGELPLVEASFTAAEGPQPRGQEGAATARPEPYDQVTSDEPARALPGELLLPRAPRARGGVAPGACLAPSVGIAPDAARALRVGLSYLKQMGGRALDRIEAERRLGPFNGFEDFYLRTRIDYPIVENLIRAGAFDSLEPDRTELLWRLPVLHDRLEALTGSAGQRPGQLRAFFSPPARAGLDRSWSLEDKVHAEIELMGLTVSCHPLELYEDELRRMGVRMSYELPTLGDEVPVTVAGVYERAQNPWMRSGKRTMFLTLEDAYGLFECVCFESKLAKIAPVVARASYFLVRGRLQNNHKRGLAVVAEEVFDLEDVLARRRARRAPGAETGAIPKKVG
jgi:DNA polymerase III alpha subunit